MEEVLTQIMQLAEQGLLHTHVALKQQVFVARLSSSFYMTFFFLIIIGLWCNVFLRLVPLHRNAKREAEKDNHMYGMIFSWVGILFFAFIFLVNIDNFLTVWLNPDLWLIREAINLVR